MCIPYLLRFRCFRFTYSGYVNQKTFHYITFFNCSVLRKSIIKYFGKFSIKETKFVLNLLSYISKNGKKKLDSFNWKRNCVK